MSHILNIIPIGTIKMHFFIIIITPIERYTTEEEYTLAICLVNFRLRHNEIRVIWSVNSMQIVLSQTAIFSQLSN